MKAEKTAHISIGMKSAVESLSKPAMCEYGAQEEQEDRERMEALRSKKFREARVPLRQSKRCRREFGGQWFDAWATFRDLIGTGIMIALIGPRGTGKTQMAAHTVRYWAQTFPIDGDPISFHGADATNNARYTRAMDIFTEIRCTYRQNSENSEHDVIREYRKPSLLIIDELQERGESAWEDRLLTHIIDCRYGDEKDTVMISNQTEDEFMKQVGSSIADRLAETGGIIVCDWPSYRGCPA